MAQRFHITLGAGTTAGGAVVTATSVCSILGVAMALEGDKVDCPACQSVGVIVCDGPRLFEAWNGRQAALHDDLCVCLCMPSPRLIAIQGLRSQSIDDGLAGLSPTVAARLVQARAPTSASSAETMPLRLIDDTTNVAYRNRPYRLDLPGKTITGVTDENGLTKPLTAAERAALVAWHVAEREG